MGEASGTLRFGGFSKDSPLVNLGHVDVDMCEACRVATLDKTQEVEDERLE